MNNLVKEFSNLVQKKNKVRIMKISELKYDEDYKRLYQQEPEKVKNIATNMKANGFDLSQPIIILPDKTVLDGHSRLQACNIAGISEVPVIIKNDIKTKDQALAYMEHLSLARRNLSESQKLTHYEHLKLLKEKLKEDGKDVSAYSDENISLQLNISLRQVQKYNEVEAHASAEDLQAIRNGEKSINQVHQEMKKLKGKNRKSPEKKSSLQKSIDEVLITAKTKLDESKYSNLKTMLETLLSE